MAGKWEEREAIRELQNKIRGLGCIITIDWTWHETDDPSYPSQYAVEDIIGATSCDVYVGRFIETLDYKGALVEMGATLAVGKDVLIIGHAIDSCLFAHHPQVTIFDTEEECLEYIFDRWCLENEEV